MTPPTEQITIVWDSAIEQIDMMLESHMMDVAREWQKRFPKRTVRWLDAMGTAGYLVDNEWVTVPEQSRTIYTTEHPHGETRLYPWGYSSGDQAKHALFQPLLDAMEWYADVVDDCGNRVGVGEFQIDPVYARKESARKK